MNFRIWKDLTSKKWYTSDVPSIPNYSWQRITPGMNIYDWYQGHYLAYALDALEKEGPNAITFALSQSPARWYSRCVLTNLYAPVERPTVKVFITFSLDYEAMLLGFCCKSFSTVV